MVRYPTLLHFAADFGLVNLVRNLLCCPGAQQACLLKNSDCRRPAEIAAASGCHELANELHSFEVSGLL